MRDIRAIISSDTAQTRAAFAEHIGEITLTPNGEQYLASGTWDFVGRGSIDGAGGPDRTVRATEFSLLWQPDTGICEQIPWAFAVTVPMEAVTH